MGNCPEDMEYQLAGGRGRVDAFLEADQVDVVRLEVLDRFEQFLEGAPEADDAEAVAGAGMVDQLRQLGFPIVTEQFWSSRRAAVMFR